LAPLICARLASSSGKKSEVAVEGGGEASKDAERVL